MRIIFLGLNDIGKRVYDWLIEQGENVLCMITSKEQLSLIEKLKPDLIICGGFRYIVPKKYLDIPTEGCINMHKSFLPYNRGANPNVWSIVENSPAGISIHYMDEGIDTGPIIAQKKVPVRFSDTARTLYKRLEREQFNLFRETWSKIKSGNIHPVRQRKKGTSHSKQDFKKLWKIDLDQECKVEEFINLLRALTFPPFKNAYVERNGKRYYLELNIIAEDDLDEGESDIMVPDYRKKD